jgi:hypothetical protein
MAGMRGRSRDVRGVMVGRSGGLDAFCAADEGLRGAAHPLPHPSAKYANEWGTRNGLVG